jgi:hypothetical protein
MAGMDMSQAGATQAGGAGGKGDVAQGGGGMAGMPGMDANHPGLPTPPKAGDPRFLDGSVGPTVKKGKANKGKKIKIPDGPGFHGAKGRKQNADDKSKNNYSVTDANFSNQLGLLPKDPDTGKPMTYVQHIQTYAAANYLESYNHPLYEKLMANQNAGKGTILGAAAHLMGLVKTADPAEAGVTQQDIAAIPAKIPGTPMDAKAYVASGKDITGQVWARPHHAGSQFKVLSGLINAGVDWKDAMVLAGDDGISGSGRLNGVNGQDNGKGGMNAGEREIFSKGAQIQQKTGINVIQIMMGGHNHLGLDPSALTKPKINKLIPGEAKDDREASAQRADAVYKLMLNGKVGDAKQAGKGGTKADNKALLKNATGPIEPKDAGPTSGGKPNVEQGGGAAAAPQAPATTVQSIVSPTSSLTGDPLQGASPDLAAAIAQIQQALAALTQQIAQIAPLAAQK